MYGNGIDTILMRYRKPDCYEEMKAAVLLVCHSIVFTMFDIKPNTGFETKLIIFCYTELKQMKFLLIQRA